MTTIRALRRLVAPIGICLCLCLAAPTVTQAASKVDELARLLLSDDSYKVRVAAAQLLGRLADPAGVEPLSRALADSNKTVRWMAVQALARIGHPSAVPALKAHLGREKDGSVRTQVEKALAALDTGAPSKKGGRIFLKFGSFSGGGPQR
jgi:HEAT repeat protein